MTELLPEHDHELENVIIGSILIDRNVLDFVFANLITDDFQNVKNKIIFNSCARLYTSSLAVDMVTVIQDIKANKEQDCTQHILSVTNKVASTANLETHVLLFKYQSIKRHLGKLAMAVMNDSIKPEISAVDQIVSISERLTEIQDRVNKKKILTFEEAVIETIDEALSNEGKNMLGIRTGFRKLDELSSGFSAPDYTIIAAGPGEGKSTFALNISKFMALNGNDVLYFSLEMKEKQLIWKLLSDELNIPVIDVRLGKFSKDHAFKTELAKARLHIYDKGGVTIDDIIAIAKMEVKTKDVKIVFIDYLQLVRLGAYGRKVANRNDEVTIISNKIKQAAMEINIPIVALSQLNRDKNRKHYTKADLRDSGSLEQDADNIIFILRPEEHDMTEYTLGTKIIGCNSETAIINIDKFRLGRTGEFEMVFKGEYSRFEDLPDESYEKTNFISNFVEPKMPKIDINEQLPF